MSRSSNHPLVDEDATSEQVYRRALELADEDSVHDVIARAGVEILSQKVPYVVQAARWQQASSYRKETRRQSLREEAGVAPLLSPSLSLWDPYEQIAHIQEFKVVADALSTLPDEDVMALWGHLEGRSDKEIMDQWVASGVGPKNPTVEVIRKRRQRALARLKVMVQSQLQGKAES